MSVVRYRSLNEELIKQFGQKVYKIPIDANFTCPNRDGNIGFGGCIFCLDGSASFCRYPSSSISEQIERGKALVENKCPSDKYIAYFQGYTNTYGPIEKLRRIFSEAINHPDIVGLSISTRPDCLPRDVVTLLSDLNKVKPVWVELGLQTIHERTANYIRRGYELEVYDETVKTLKKNGLYVITHMIIGLPGEKKDDIVETAQYIGESGADGIKFQLLHVMTGTDLEKDYREGLFNTLSLDKYIDILEECIKVIPTSMTVHRLTGDGDKHYLIAPMWSANKKYVLNQILAAFERDNVIQGSELPEEDE